MSRPDKSSENIFDVVIIGAGISGINAAYRLQEQAPDRTYTILEARHALGGTWDLFKYPGIRSDSDLHTFGFPFYPWTEERAIADGPSIKRYMETTAATFGIDQKIQYHHKLLAADWSTDQQGWSLTVDASGENKFFHSKFVIFCSGYYDYNEALPAQIPGIDKFEGPVIHPQFWPEDLDYENKEVVIIGSGATAITLLPNLAEKAKNVIMLQRSPTYIVSIPQVNGLSYYARRLLPLNWAYKFTRLQFLILPFLFFKFCKSFPNAARKQLKKGAAKQLPKDYPLEPNFEPKYSPWDQRLCVSPNGDFYQCIREGKAEVVTAHIKQVTEKTISLEGSDRKLQPDIIVTATGLKLLMAGGAQISVDKTPITISDKHLWKGIMLQDVPNAAIVVGYTNASWTLGADATAQFVTRLLNKMKNEGISQATPTLDASSKMGNQSILNLNSTYVVKAKGDLPKAGDRAPWLPRSHYLTDLWESKYGNISQDMLFSRIST
ncbi:hypothetical protein MBLNU459_g3027t1 [Dothideomycetes sp. NU459]